ncbi:nucleotidyltransferase family protein [Cohnella luojiensis]|uniref:Nucleotidyltransferase family protein n=1 Tax=Cohnella luojiensis TaxID=652876 RepID=A0A4Y8LUK6_9BACL|nr:nucleotidyltransferase family protein [Cohnella luojiensis]TFE22598.1 nucleotidyltransferase family protein [Cohnella luojiensis]
MDKARHSGINLDLNSQMEILVSIIRKNSIVETVFQRIHSLPLDQYYVGAGCLTQTIWNYLSGYDLQNGISDIDIVYYDLDLAYEKENELIEQARHLFRDFPIQIDLKNQARVHLWYEDHFGYPIEPYPSLQAAINTWPTTATALGVNKDSSSKWKVYAPFGLNDLFGMVVRPNKTLITEEVFVKKVTRWTKHWPQLTVIPWNT